MYKLTIKQSKAQSWDKFVDEMNENLDTGELWNRIMKVKRTNANRSIIQLMDENDDMTDDPVQITDGLGEFYSKVSSKENLKSWKRRNENIHVFTVKELEMALKNTVINIGFCGQCNVS